MGNIAHINETCRHDIIVPKPITINIPKLNDITDSDARLPRNDDSLARKGNKKIFKINEIQFILAFGLT